MTATHRRNPRTASTHTSIWEGDLEALFTRDVLALKKKYKESPIPPRNAPAQYTHNSPWFNLEKRLVDDIAFLGATVKGPERVCAVRVSGLRDTGQAIAHVACNEGVPRATQDFFEIVAQSLQSVATSRQSRAPARKQILELGVELHRERIHHRLGSAKYDSRGRMELRPKWPSLWRRIEALTQMLGAEVQLDVKKVLDRIGSLYRLYDESSSGYDPQALCRLVTESHLAIESTESLEATISKLCAFGTDTNFAQIRSILTDVAKIGRYYGIPSFLTEAARSQRLFFEHLQFNFLEPFTAAQAPIAGQAGTLACHVHAEVQIIVALDAEQDLDSDGKAVIVGSSKATCYLCQLFIDFHGGIHAAHTHNTLYHKWTLPSLSTYSAKQVLSYRKVIRDMQKELGRANSAPSRWVQQQTNSVFDVSGMFPLVTTPSQTASLLSAATSGSVLLGGGEILLSQTKGAAARSPQTPSRTSTTTVHTPTESLTPRLPTGSSRNEGMVAMNLEPARPQDVEYLAPVRVTLESSFATTVYFAPMLDHSEDHPEQQSVDLDTLVDDSEVKVEYGSVGKRLVLHTRRGGQAKAVLIRLD